MSKSENDRDQAERETRKTLNSLEGIDDIEAGPYFYTRLKARIDSAGHVRDPWVVRALLGGRLVPTMLAVVFVLNVLSAVVVLSDAEDSQIEVQQTYREALAEEYLLSGTSSWLEITTE